MPRDVTEFIGTLFLVLTIGLTTGTTDFAPLAIGATLMVMVSMGAMSPERTTTRP